MVRIPQINMQKRIAEAYRAYPVVPVRRGELEGVHARFVLRVQVRLSRHEERHRAHCGGGGLDREVAQELNAEAQIVLRGTMVRRHGSETAVFEPCFRTIMPHIFLMVRTFQLWLRESFSWFDHSDYGSIMVR